MSPYARLVLAFLENEDGPTAVEYAVMLALIIAVCVGAITTLGNNTKSVYGNAALNTAVTVSTSS
jgi:pilus assembly protein Flp/PilA